MLGGLKRALVACLAPLDVTVLRASELEAMQRAMHERGRELQELQRQLRDSADREFVRALPSAQRARVAALLRESRSQIRQDLFVLSELDFKRDGYFVEFGAASGIGDSNTYLLERDFAWRGILAEPAKFWHDGLKANRSASISTQCVWRESNRTLLFNEVELAGLSTIDAFSGADSWHEQRKKGHSYEVQTISLMDLLEQFAAPPAIDYLSIDTEGSELEILKAFDFGRYRIAVITCEHNFTPARAEIRALLARNGYVRKYEALSRFDDWYVLAGSRSA
ncbi:MAG TPA: FkbM family methyltransferase [Steroidobacteraceae bacterium]|nr:FkbM family methyltransferase [Steroidobacteraceae bacterium]